LEQAYYWKVRFTMAQRDQPAKLVILPLQDNGPICTCGNRGCLEAIAGGWAIAREAVTAAKTNRRSQLALITPVESITARDVITAARNGDLTSQKIMMTLALIWEPQLLAL